MKLLTSLASESSALAELTRVARRLTPTQVELLLYWARRFDGVGAERSSSLLPADLRRALPPRSASDSPQTSLSIPSRLKQRAVASGRVGRAVLLAFSQLAPIFLG